MSWFNWQVGVHTYNAFVKINFTLRVAFLWTMSDFPRLGMVSGRSSMERCMTFFTGNVKAKQLPYNRNFIFYGLLKGFLKKCWKKWRTGFVVRTMLVGIGFPPPKKLHSRKGNMDGFPWLDKCQQPFRLAISGSTMFTPLYWSHAHWEECIWQRLPHYN